MSDLPVGLRIAQQNQIQLPQSEADAVDVQGKGAEEQSPQFAETPSLAPGGQPLTTIDAVSAESSANVAALVVGQQQAAPPAGGNKELDDLAAEIRLNQYHAASRLAKMETKTAANLLSQIDSFLVSLVLRSGADMDAVFLALPKEKQDAVLKEMDSNLGPVSPFAHYSNLRDGAQQGSPPQSAP